MTESEEHFVQITSMGFSEDQAREALAATQNNLEAAVNHILSGAPVAPPASVSVAPVPRTAAATAKAVGGLLQCSRSQYNVENGRSACTCIALTAATKFLQSLDVTSEFLEEMITQGVETYQRLNALSPIEHLSAEEVLQKDAANVTATEKVNFPLTNLGIRQGILGNDLYHPMGMKSMLAGIRQEQPRDKWLAVLMTKTPETVLLCFSPSTEAIPAFWLIDSHPRPQLGVESAYAKLHPSLDALLMSLEAIFPATELGPDIPEMMAMMYNSFDLYPFLLQE